MSKAAKLYYAVAVVVAIFGCVNTAANLQRGVLIDETLTLNGRMPPVGDPQGEEM